MKINRTIKKIRINLICSLGFVLLAAGTWTEVSSQEVYRSFELRYYTPDEKADGDTDFKGQTEYFDTEKRLEYLDAYEKSARKFFENENWDQKVVSDEEAKAIAEKIKPQPLPSVRDRIVLNSWKMLGYKTGKREAEVERMEWWNRDGLEVKDGELHFMEKQSKIIDIESQEWRSLISLDFKPAATDEVQEISLGEAQKISFSKGSIMVNVDGKSTPVANYGGTDFVNLKIETDLENGKYNLYVGGRLVVDFLPLDKSVSFDNINISGAKGCIVDNLYGVKYTVSVFTDDIHTRDVPFQINTFLNEDFSITPKLHGWQAGEYDDSEWKGVELPYAHGGDRYKHESMYLRKKVYIGDFVRANLNLETLDPGGEIWINGKVVAVVHKRTPFSMDITDYLKKNSENTIGLKVFPNKVEITNRHTSADFYTGWFAGRTWIDLHQKQYIKDVFVYTRVLDENAVVSVSAEMMNQDWRADEREWKTTREFNGFVKVQFYKWFPLEEAEPVLEKKFPVNLRLNRDVTFSEDILLESPDKWHFNDPRLYKVVVSIEDEDGKVVDDYVVTTGIRTVSQEGGTFRINGEPEMMNGALLFAYKYPLEDIARTLRCADDYWLVKEIMMMKRTNGNMFRMSVHHGMKGGINDPRLAEIGDQMGFMFQWSTGSWVRTGTPWIIDFDALAQYVKQVRNHPSIVMWQPGNHPKFKNFKEEATAFYQNIYQSIYPNDPSRLISPTASGSRFGDQGTPNDMGTLIGKNEAFEADPVWTAPMITRGNMDHTTGYGAQWSTLRKYPVPPEFIGEQGWREKGYRVDYLNSRHRAYFDFESEESAGQPNWTLRKGKPSYQILSYELNYDVGSIGRNLRPDEWRVSQAWQGFSAFEAYKKKRWLDYDGMAWCSLHGGGNTSTYQKPLIDYFGYSKISFHTVKMAFQDVLACSGNVDVVYGPNDKLPVKVINLGDQKLVDVTVTCRDLNGKKIFSKKFSKVSLDKGRNSYDLGEIDLDIRKEGFYVFVYEVN